MKKGLFPKMVIAYTLIIAMSFVVVASILSIWFQGYYYNQRKNQLKSEEPYIETAAIGYLEKDDDIENVKEKLKYLAGYSSTDIILVNYYGFAYCASNDKYNDLMNTQLITEDLATLTQNKEVDPAKSHTDIFKNNHVIIEPIFHDGVFEGAIIMVTTLDEMKRSLYSVYLIIWLSAMIAILFSFFIIYYFSQKSIIKPLSEINNVAGKISKGEVGKRLNINSNDEIGELARAFNSMADSLEQVENNRKIFISNVSHELRSPITSIKGFIGGIMDGVIPKDKENYYLSIAYEEIQRLTRLVNDLLDLSAIESGQMKINVSSLDINEIIKQCVIKFSTEINAKRINVNVRFEGNALLVLADRDRIIQVVTNLIDNAIKYVGEGGTIRISSRTKGNKALVSVFNDGPAISEEDIKHIWDRFYKADKSRTSKSSTGLGLPIVRSIVTQHGEDIWVENRPEEGVTFTFALRRP